MNATISPSARNDYDGEFSDVVDRVLKSRTCLSLTPVSSRKKFIRTHDRFRRIVVQHRGTGFHRIVFPRTHRSSEAVSARTIYPVTLEPSQLKKNHYTRSLNFGQVHRVGTKLTSDTLWMLVASFARSSYRHGPWNHQTHKRETKLEAVVGSRNSSREPRIQFIMI